ncbi:arginase [Savagea sp. SN6]|uniref:Arginase n=1 Tax=Savagea serpentis TaxID=2785297 RepID=A0A8J7G664_9BACL|nr:arginase [Savagea serpentis]MBF4501031.1 arginase [Savagea serpentis]
MGELKISIVGVPLDYGQSRRGVDMGPSAIRYAGAVERLQALGHHVRDEGDIHVSAVENKPNLEERLKNLEEVVKANKALAKKVDEIVKEGRFPLVLGGDHSIAIGTLAGLTETYQNLGVIWFDAHADMNTAETSPSGNIHGMPLAVSMGYGHEHLTALFQQRNFIKPENLIIIGARSIDPGERHFIQKLGIKVFTMHEIDKYGMAVVMEQTIAHLKERDVDGVHLSLDLDGLDPLYTPGVGTPVDGGMTYRESHLALEMLQQSQCITSAEFVEVNPILDEKNKTADVAVTLMGSLLGETLI